MFFFDKPSKGPMGTNKRKSGPASNDPAFEQWVARQLHKMYDDVLAEEVPSELLRVVDQMTGKSNGGADPSDSGDDQSDGEDAERDGASPGDRPAHAPTASETGCRRR
jgi:hypothetical protein